MAGTTADRTEKPTPRRLRDARKKGQVARSRDLGQAAALLAVMVLLGWVGSDLLRVLATWVGQVLGGLDRFSLRDLAEGDVSSLAWSVCRAVFVLVGPVALTTAGVVLAVHTAQGGWVFAPQALELDWSRLSPAQGLKRLGFSRVGVDSIKMAVAVVAVSVLSVNVVRGVLVDTPRLVRVEPIQAAMLGWTEAVRLLKQVGLALAIIALGDYGVQRWRLMSSLKMSKQEVRDDMRLTEGSPEIKARVRKVQLEMVRRRMLAAVPRATLVITNPTEYAVALEYHRERTPAPRVVAKGRGFLAARIKAVAREHQVPIVENVPLAQALYKGTEVGDFIPGALFEAVAEVLAYLIRLKQLVV